MSSVGPVARQIAEEHIDIVLDAGINLEGINAEVAKGQWEFQIFAKDPRILAMTCGSLVTFWFASARSTV